VSSTGFHQPWDFFLWSPYRTANLFLKASIRFFATVCKRKLRKRTQTSKFISIFAATPLRITSNGYNPSANTQFSIAFLINGLQFYRCNFVFRSPFIITGISRETGRLIGHKQNIQLTRIETWTAAQPQPEC
jgi:hypothetical protein